MAHKTGPQGLGTQDLYEHWCHVQAFHTSSWGGLQLPAGGEQEQTETQAQQWPWLAASPVSCLCSTKRPWRWPKPACFSPSGPDSGDAIQDVGVYPEAGGGCQARHAHVPGAVAGKVSVRQPHPMATPTTESCPTQGLIYPQTPSENMCTPQPLLHPQPPAAPVNHMSSLRGPPSRLRPAHE